MPSPTSRRPTFVSRAIPHLLAAATLLVLGFANLAPLLDLAGEGLQGFEGSGGAWQRQLLGNSVLITALGTFGAGLLGVPLGLALARGRLPWRGVWLAACCVPLATPIHAWATTWILLLGRNGWIGQGLAALLGLPEPPFTVYGPVGVGLLLALRHAPLVALAVWSALWARPAALEEVALLETGPLRTLWAASWPLAKPLATAAMALVALLCLVEYELPALLEAPVYPVFIVSQFQLYREIGRVLAAALPALGLSVAVLLWAGWGAWSIWRRRETWDALDTAPGPALVPRALAFAMPLVAVVLPVVLVVGTLAYHTGGWRPFGTVLVSARDNILYGLTVAVSSAAFATAVAFACAAAVRLSRPHHVLPAFALLAIPWVVPLPLISVATATWLTTLRTWGLHVADAGLVWPTAAWLAVPAAVLAVAAALRIDTDLLDAARVDGAGLVGILRWVLWPALWLVLALAFLAGCVLALNEITLAVLLCPPGRATLAVRLASLLHYAPQSITSALCLVQLALVALPLAGALTVVFWLRPTRASRPQPPL